MINRKSVEKLLAVSEMLAGLADASIAALRDDDNDLAALSSGPHFDALSKLSASVLKLSEGNKTTAAALQDFCSELLDQLPPCSDPEKPKPDLRVVT